MIALLSKMYHVTLQKECYVIQEIGEKLAMKYNPSYRHISHIPLHEIQHLIPKTVLEAMRYLKPKSYFEGGTAREILLAVFSPITKTAKESRDFDILHNDWERNYIREYYQNLGWDVEFAATKEWFFRGADIGLNQALLGADGLYFTEKAKREASNLRIRPTPYEYRHENDRDTFDFFSDANPIRGKVLLRMLLFSIRYDIPFEDRYIEMLNRETPSYFWLLVFMFKAYQTGVADEFFDALHTYTLPPNMYDNPEQLLVDLVDKVDDFEMTQEQLQIYRNAQELLLIDDYT